MVGTDVNESSHRSKTQETLRFISGKISLLFISEQEDLIVKDDT